MRRMVARAMSSRRRAILSAALAVIATASLSVPAVDRRVRVVPEIDFGLPTAAEVRALPQGLEGVTLSLEVKTEGDETHVRATIHNAGPDAAVVAWPEPCTAGARVFADGDTMLVVRALRLPPKVWRDLHDWEAIGGYGLALAVGDTVVEDIQLRSPVAECTVDTRLGTLGRRLGEVAPSTRVLVAYEVAPLPDEAFVTPGLRKTGSDGPGRRRLAGPLEQGPPWRILHAEARLPFPLPVVRSRPAHPAVRTWQDSGPATCEAFPAGEPQLVRRPNAVAGEEPPPVARALLPPDTTGKRWQQPAVRAGHGWLGSWADHHAAWWRVSALMGDGSVTQVLAPCPGDACRPDLGDVIGLRAESPTGWQIEAAHNASWLAARYVERTPGWAASAPLDKLRAALRQLLGIGFGCAPIRLEWVETPDGLRASTAFDTPWPSVRRFDERVDFWVDGEGVSMIMAKRYRLAGVGGWSHVEAEGWFEAMAAFAEGRP